MANKVIDEPTEGGLRETWVLWSVLNFLDAKAKAGEVYVPAGELREFASTLADTNDRRDDILRVLRRAQAIARMNNTGRVNKSYYLTKIGQSLMETYQKTLTEGEKQ